MEDLKKEQLINSKNIANEMGIRHSELLKRIEGSDNGKYKGYINHINKLNENINYYFISNSYKDITGKNNKCYLITKQGIKFMLDLSNNPKYIKGLQKTYEEMGGDVSNITTIERFETTFFNKLRESLVPMDIHIETQKPMFDNKYRIDGYIKEYNLAIEYDEAQHFEEPQKSLDIERQNEIQEFLKCDFVRLDYRNSDAFNIGLVFKEIINK